MRFKLNSLCARAGLLLSGALLFSACSGADQEDQTSPETADVNAPRLLVVGEGKASAKPDIAKMNLGVEAKAPTVSEALTLANSQMSAVIEALKSAGVADKDLRTSNFSISFEQPENQPSVYRVSNMVVATVRDPNKAGAVLEAAVNAGANDVWSVSFELDDTRAVEAQARAAAVADARTRAEDLAKLNGLRLGPIAAISTVIGASPGLIPHVMSAEKVGGAAPPLEAGELTWSTQVEVVFELLSASGTPAAALGEDG